ncbi:ATP-binding cassette domain-containing protein, partial [Pluralibacter gergoviae]|nr:ATP-binding cassette domain-containing protein [Pluralibacter gergoviae]
MIEFQQVTKRFGGRAAVKDLNLTLREGAFSVLIGTSGSGKSTTLKMINRLEEHDEGTIRFAGEDIRRQPVLDLRRRMGYAIQSIGLFPHWTVAQNIATVPQLQKWPRQKINDRIDELLALLGLEPAMRGR